MAKSFWQAPLLITGTLALRVSYLCLRSINAAKTVLTAVLDPPMLLNGVSPARHSCRSARWYSAESSKSTPGPSPACSRPHAAWRRNQAPASRRLRASVVVGVVSSG